MMMMILKVMMMMPAASIESDTDVDVCNTIGELNVKSFCLQAGLAVFTNLPFNKVAHFQIHFRLPGNRT